MSQGPSGEEAESDDYQSGLALYKAGKLDEALACLEKLLQAQPDDCRVLRLAGAIHTQRGEHSKAVRCLRKIVVLKPDSASDVYNLGVAQQAAGDIGSARHCYESALAVDPSYTYARDALDALPASTRAPD